MQSPTIQPLIPIVPHNKPPLEIPLYCKLSYQNRHQYPHHLSSTTQLRKSAQGDIFPHHRLCQLLPQREWGAVAATRCAELHDTLRVPGSMLDPKLSQSIAVAGEAIRFFFLLLFEHF